MHRYGVNLLRTLSFIQLLRNATGVCSWSMHRYGVNLMSRISPYLIFRNYMYDLFMHITTYLIIFLLLNIQDQKKKKKKIQDQCQKKKNIQDRNNSLNV